ncbi:MAG: type II toxin-antitoxin system RelE/ParE family toxin [Alphaproteobacteria bacterium]
MDKRIIGGVIKTIEYGWPIGMPVCKPLGDGLYEVRSTISSKREIRIIFYIRANQMILLHGFIKKSQKTPDKELELVKKRKKEVM